MEKGIVKRLVKERNFGFVRGDITRIDYFFHREDFEDYWEDLKEGDKVTFEVVKSPKGPRASEVSLSDND